MTAHGEDDAGKMIHRFGELLGEMQEMFATLASGDQQPNAQDFRNDAARHRNIPIRNPNVIEWIDEMMDKAGAKYNRARRTGDASLAVQTGAYIDALLDLRNFFLRGAA